MKLQTTILIQLLNASVCNRSGAIINLSNLATANGICNAVQNKVIALSKYYDSIDNVLTTIEGIIIESEIEDILLTEK